ncbi:MAG: hypothetical protein DMF49_07515 [Acidobacteria bacterium]|nr:MAG: hypothetical protein DMF49_07515 [Acidobacteriota bacterium]
MKRLVRVALAAAIALVALSAAAVIAGVVFLRSTLPRTHGRARLPGLAAPVSVWRDRWGVPTIRASSMPDAMMALGYVHASDRLWQMEMRRRGALGRLSEIFGPDAVDADFEQRGYDLESLARKDLAAATEGVRRAVLAYAAGVNGYLRSHTFRLPPEFLILRFRPEPWRPEDSFAFARLMLLKLSVSERAELDRYDHFLRLGAPRALALMHCEPNAPADLIRPELPEYFRAAAPLHARSRSARPLSDPQPAPGSNCWAICGSMAASGSPILANDPHLGIEQPSVWYEAGILAPGLELRGLTLAGLPGVVIGRNRHIAWGITAHQADDQDLYIERLDGSSPPKYLEGDRWIPAVARVVSVKVRGATPVNRVLLRTSRGPLMPPDPGSLHPAMSIEAAALEGGNPIPAFWEICQTRDSRGLLEALRGYSSTTLNFTYADDAGAVGFKTAGFVPRRRAGDGRLPVPGWTGAYGWDGRIPSDQLPGRSYDRGSAEGIVVTANNFLLDQDSPTYAGEWAPSFRADRIAERLRQRRNWTVEAMGSVQSDVLSGMARRMVAAVQRIVAGRPQGASLPPQVARPLEVLGGWDGNMLRRGPSRLLEELTRELVERVTGDEARSAGGGTLVGPFGLLRLLEDPAGSDWFDDVSTPRRESSFEIVSAALASAYRRVVTQCGEDPARWDWGQVHQASFQHLLGPPTHLARWFDLGPVGMPGDNQTVNAQAYLVGSPFRIVHIPSARVLFDLADPDHALSVLPTGQSGHPLSPHYGDQLSMWAAGEYHPAPLTEAAARAVAVETLILTP